MRDVAGGGNRFATILHDGRGAVAGLQHLPAREVGIERLPSGRLRYRHSNPFTSAQRVFLAEEVAHARYATRDGLLGVGPLEWARGAVALAFEQQELAASQAANGFVPPTVFQTQQGFPNEELAEAAFQRLKEQLAAGSRPHAP